MAQGAWLGALKERGFRLYFVGQLTSNIGTYMALVAVTFALLDSHHSATDLGGVLAARSILLVVCLLVGGVVADRLGRRRVMLAADSLRAAAQAALGLWVLIGHPPLLAFLLLSAAVGTGSGFFSPALLGLIPEIVSSERLRQANALDGLTISIGTVAGPAVAGLIVAVANPGWAIVADALSYAVSVGCLALIRVTRKERAAASLLGQLREGWSEFWSRTWLWSMVLQWSVGNALIIGPFFVLGAVVSKAYLGGPTAWGTILAAQGVGAAAGGLVMLRFGSVGHSSSPHCSAWSSPGSCSASGFMRRWP